MYNYESERVDPKSNNNSTKGSYDELAGLSYIRVR